MAGHTREDYAKLLVEYLNKKGMHVVLSPSRSAGGKYSWNGDMRLKRQVLVGQERSGASINMNADACLYVDDEGEIRLYYSEPIVFDLEKKAKKEAARRAEEEELLRSLVSEDEDEQDETDGEEFCFDFDEDKTWDGLDDMADEGEADGGAENGADLDENTDREADEEETEYLSSEEDDEHISERKWLQILEMLQEGDFRIRIHGRSNETRVYFSVFREMDSCSRNSAKKAAEWIYDQLFVACHEIRRLANELKFHREQLEDKNREWYDELLTDSFENVEKVCLILGKEAEIDRCAEKQKEYEEMIGWCKDSSDDLDGAELNWIPFRKMSIEAFRASLQEEKEKQEALRREVDELKANLIRS